jgi:hypothetical protein
MASPISVSNVQQRLKKLLNKLGDNKTEVADSLKASNCIGVKSSLESCPVANYVRASIAFPGKVYADQDTVDVIDPTDGTILASTSTPLQIAQFMTAFDDTKEFNFLEMEEDLEEEEREA